MRTSHSCDIKVNNLKVKLYCTINYLLEFQNDIHEKNPINIFKLKLRNVRIQHVLQYKGTIRRIEDTTFRT